jgi:hypothetical protein
VSDALWCPVTSSGSGNGMIIADYAENPSYQSRIANIRVIVAGLPEQIVTLTQAKSTNGIEEDQDVAFQICPNPTKGIFKIIPSSGDKRSLDIIVQDIQGKSILKKHCKGEKEYIIDLSSAPQGIYHIIMETNNKLAVQKIVIIR